VEGVEITFAKKWLLFSPLILYAQKQAIIACFWA